MDQLSIGKKDQLAIMTKETNWISGQKGTAGYWAKQTTSYQGKIG